LDLPLVSPQVHDVSKMLHLFNGAHLFGVFLADVLVDGQHALSNERLRHHRHITKIVGNEEHPDDGSLWVEKRRLNSSLSWDRISFAGKAELALQKQIISLNLFLYKSSNSPHKESTCASTLGTRRRTFAPES
jgi:hypothetical protein